MALDNIRAKLDERAPKLAKLLADSDIEKIWQSPKTYREHPLVPIFRCLLNAHSDPSVMQNTEMAFRQMGLRPEHSAWANSRTSKCLQIADYSSAASALGEIRAGGALLHAGFNVEPIPESDKPTCDFKIHLNRLEVFIEVATKQMAGLTADLLANSGSGQERSICPGGAPDPEKQGETIGDNAGQKFASIKPNAKQVPAGSVALLWVDIQDEDWWPAATCHAKPVVSHNGEFYSGGIWHGFYGIQGTPQFEQQSTEERIKKVKYAQTYPGLFSQHGRWSGAILSFRDSTIIFEHPSPDCSMPAELTRSLLGLPKADYSEWWTKWPSMRPDAVSERVQTAIRDLEELAEKACFSW